MRETHAVMQRALGSHGLGVHTQPPSCFRKFGRRATEFDSDTPGQPGAVAIKSFEGASFGQQGHAVLYIGEHQVIQAIFDPGVTDEYTDQWLYAWGGDFAFEWYGFLPGVQYPG